MIKTDENNEFAEVIRNLEFLTKEINEVSNENIETIREDLLKLCSLKSLLGTVYAKALYYHDVMLGRLSDKYQDLPATVFKNKLQGELSVYRYYINLCDRLNSTIERVSENKRSILSDLKEERRHYGTQ